ncbi:MAG: PhzF family phenazine biosynthesis protein [Candidatus Cloacimonetes bacterium]|nr:PhzF family phenazine biosynthesis protein [Candidatus Cloacimonadota bacterium]
MNKYKFLQIDAFTTTPFKGNPCAVVLDADNLTSADMLNIAKEMNLSETAFLLKGQKSDFKARYFTPNEEIPLAGHPTIALSHALVELRLIDISNQHSSFTLELPAGIITVFLKSLNSQLFITMRQLKPKFLSLHDPKCIAPLFHLKEEDFVSSVPIQTISTGTPQLMMQVKNKSILDAAFMNTKLYQQYKTTSDFFSPHIFCIEKQGSQQVTHARHFGVAPDILEDPFTGSASGGMSAFLWKHKQLEQAEFTAYQGENLGRLGVAKLKVFGSREDIDYVEITGQAVTLIRGEICL